MGIEIERKFLVRNDSWRSEIVSSHPMEQGYLACGPPTAVRVRIEEGRATLNIKKATLAIERAEFEFPLPLAEARAILDGLCLGHVIRKIRHRVPMEELVWEIDEFEGVNSGLIVAEIEVPQVDAAIPTLDWLGEEVSDDPRFLNTSLTQHPFSMW